MKSFSLPRKDVLVFARDRRLLLAALLIAVLALTAIITGFGQVRAYERDRLTTETRDMRTWLGQGKRNPHTAAHLSMWALRPLSAPAVLDPGVFPYAGAAIWMEAHSRNPARNRPVEDRAGGLDVGQFSLAWVLQTLLPLAIMVIAAGVVAREREQGTFRLLLAGGLTPGRVATDKLRGVLAITALLALPLAAVGVGAALVMAGNPTAAELVRLSLWALIYFVWFIIVALVAVSVSIFSRNTASAILILIGVWLTAAFIAPRAGAAIADVVAPTPAADRFWAGVGADLEKFPPDIAQQFEASVLKRYNVSRKEDLPVSFAGLQLEWGEGIGHQVFDVSYGRLDATYMQQRSAMRWVAPISPLPALQNLSMALAGTDMLHQQSFNAQAEVHRRKVVRTLNMDMAANALGQDFDYKAGSELWQRIPAFSYTPPASRTVAANVWPDALILLGWLAGAGLIFASAVRRLRKAPA